MPQQPHPLCGLPLMMGLVQSQLMSWPIGLSYANNGSPLSKFSSANGQTLPPNYSQALHKEALQRNSQFVSGVLKYIHSPLPGPQPSASQPIGDLHYYASPHPVAKNRPAILCIPSLVNRSYILDLSPQTSLIRYLNNQGFDCYLLEWPLPNKADAEKKFEDYLLWLLDLLQQRWAEIDRPLIGLGYCMGGLMAVALAQLFPRVQSLVLLATPWDYTQYPLAQLTSEQEKLLDSWVEAEPLFQAEALQLLLYMANPYRLYQRFSRFAQEKCKESIASFVALEHWANDSIPITRALARECLIEWPRRNSVASGKWRVAGEVINPTALKIPALVAIPLHDHIVPACVSEPLGKLLPQATIITPHAGHVGMIAGMRRRELWDGLGEWLTHLFVKIN